MATLGYIFLVLLAGAAVGAAVWLRAVRNAMRMM